MIVRIVSEKSKKICIIYKKNPLEFSSKMYNMVFTYIL